MKEKKEASIKFIINLSSTLLTLLIGFIFFVQDKNIMEIYLTIFTLTLLLLSILVNQRKKHRLCLRTDIFNQKIKEFMDVSLDSIIEAFYKLGKQNASEKAEKFFKEYSDLIKNKSKDEVKFYLDLYFDNKNNDDKKSINNLSGLVTDGVMINIEKIRTESFNQPIKERFSKLNFIIDMISFKCGYYIFTFGVLGFLITSTVLLI